ncbi:HAD-IIIA family hydrolase, partial [Acaryochloris marina NIES-2412]|uniref:HAD-IIIA family hydrolase n=1 Tax=Acaryochloris marina TaxID=155978 RepID=UPI0040599FC8
VFQAHLLIITSNQVGVSAGYKTIEDTISEMQYCLHLLPEIKSASFCPNFECNPYWHVKRRGSYKVDMLNLKGRMRNPGDGMIQQVLWAYPGVSEVLFIGDRQEDEQAAHTAGVAFQSAESWRLPRE